MNPVLKSSIKALKRHSAPFEVFCLFIAQIIIAIQILPIFGVIEHIK